MMNSYSRGTNHESDIAAVLGSFSDGLLLIGVKVAGQLPNLETFANLLGLIRAAVKSAIPSRSEIFCHGINKIKFTYRCFRRIHSNSSKPIRFKSPTSPLTLFWECRSFKSPIHKYSQ